MIKNVFRAVTALGLLLGLLAVPAAPVSAAPGHITLACGSYASTGWQYMIDQGSTRGRICTTLRHDGDHVDLTYRIEDTNCDGIDLFLSRELSYDGPTYLGSPTGCGTSYVSNKQYDIVTDSRWARSIGKTDILGGLTHYGSKLYW